jgi:hypothetical protein
MQHDPEYRQYVEKQERRAEAEARREGRNPIPPEHRQARLRIEAELRKRLSKSTD